MRESGHDVFTFSRVISGIYKVQRVFHAQTWAKAKELSYIFYLVDFGLIWVLDAQYVCLEHWWSTRATAISQETLEFPIPLGMKIPSRDEAGLFSPFRTCHCTRTFYIRELHAKVGTNRCSYYPVSIDHCYFARLWNCHAQVIE